MSKHCNIEYSGITRTKALMQLEKDHKGIDFLIGKKPLFRPGWEHEHEGYERVGRFSAFSSDAKHKLVFAVYGRERHV